MIPTRELLSPGISSPERYAMAIDHRDDLLKRFKGRRTEDRPRRACRPAQGEEVREDERVYTVDGIDGEGGYELVPLHLEDVLTVIDLDDIS